MYKRQMWYLSPVAGSFSGRGLYWARAGTARHIREAVSPTMVYKRMIGFCISVREWSSRAKTGGGEPRIA